MTEGYGRLVTHIKHYYTTGYIGFIAIIAMILSPVYATTQISEEPIQACVWADAYPRYYRNEPIAQCLDWKEEPSISKCHGRFAVESPLPSLADPKTIELKADQVSLNPAGQSELHGHVQVKQDQRVVNAQTATIYRDPTTQQVTQITLNSNVQFREPGHWMHAQSAQLNPQDKSGKIQQVLYRLNTDRFSAQLPAWGTAAWVKRFANEDYQFHQVTYSTCSPLARAWQIEANDIHLYKKNATGVARKAILRLGNVPVLYTPYLSFPTSRARKSGFLMPLGGYTNVSGFDFAFPYYLNLAPNYDATVIPHLYTLRGWMFGGNTRFLTQHSRGMVAGNILPKDQAFRSFIHAHDEEFPILNSLSTNRWSVLVRDNIEFVPNLNLNIDFQQVSDDYYLQDFNTNLAISSENQLLRRGTLSYTTDHWILGGTLQSYQTLHPVNQSMIADIYDRLPQLVADGVYSDLPFNSQLSILNQFDYFRWTGLDHSLPQGSRYHLNPILSVPMTRTWGYITPNVELVENNYGLSKNSLANGEGYTQNESFNRIIPRFYVDGGLTFERTTTLLQNKMTQTLEPRLYYLLVPFANQSEFPAFDSAYMIFNTDQLYRTNRFSGFDRISDANQLAYGLTTRWLSQRSGREKAMLTVGQLHYFSPRRVELCYAPLGQCTDSPLFLGYVSPTAAWSPIASKATYKLNEAWDASADYTWDNTTHRTNNGNLNLHYQPQPNRILGLSYSYLVSGNVFVAPEVGVKNGAMNQITGSYAWPMNEYWSSLGVYSYNVSQQYSMLALFGVQYDSCCWAFRLMGGRSFKSLGLDSLSPQYNNNIYFQILLKGLGSVATSNPATALQSYLPGYPNLFN